MVACQGCGTASPPGARFCGACGAALGQVVDAPAVRKHVIVFFVDIVGSTSLGERLDPESLRGYLKRYFDTVSEILWRHGGTVEKFIGDAVMAVFGVPVAREDDATRALDAAIELHAAVAEISAGLAREYDRTLRVRIGINGGEVFVSRHPDGQVSVTGDAVNVAARLEQGAGPGETLVGGTVAALAGRDAPLRPIEPLTVRGKSETLPAWRLDTDVVAPSAGPQAPLVGREEELADLHRVADRVTRRGDSYLVTVLGAAGIGKSRLIEEFVAARSDLRVFEGHCQSYASGGTFWPLSQVLEQLGDDWREQVRALRPTEASQMIDRLATAVGDVDRQTGLDDIVWAARSLVEALAQDQPVMLIWEDLQWAEPTFLEFLDRLSARIRSVPVLMVCVSRPDLLMAYPSWGGGRSCVMSVELAPLTRDALRDLMDEMTGAVVAHGGPVGAVLDAGHDLDRLAALSEGNPLIVLQMLEFAASSGTLGGGMTGAVPVTVATLFEAQLDRLGPAERLFCECAAVMGREFWGRGVRFAADELSVSDVEFDEMVERLIRLDVLQATRARNGGRPGHRFTHTLLMETVYRATPKTRRSRWHGRVASWLASAPHLGDGERSELTAYHLERAHALAAEMSRDDPATAQLAIAAAEAATSASNQCLARADFPAAVRLLSQAQRLLPAGDRRHYDVVRHLFDCLTATGDLDAIPAVLDVADTALHDDPIWTVLGPVPRATLALRTNAGSHSAAYEISAHAVTGLTGRAEPGALMWAYELAALAHMGDLQLSAAERAVREGLAQAREARDGRAERRMLTGLCELAFWGPTPVREARALCAELLPIIESDLQLTTPVLAIMASLAALDGEAVVAADLMARARRIAVELDLASTGTLLRQYQALILTLAGDSALAADEYLAAADELSANESAAAMFRLMAARALLLAGQTAAARHVFGERSPDAHSPESPEDPYFLALWYGVAARLASLDADAVRAREWASMAVAMAGTVEDPRSHADALIDLASVNRLVGDLGAAQFALSAARQQLIRKGATRSLELVAQWSGERAS